MFPRDSKDFAIVQRIYDAVDGFDARDKVWKQAQARAHFLRSWGLKPDCAAAAEAAAEQARLACGVAAAEIYRARQHAL